MLLAMLRLNDDITFFFAMKSTLYRSNEVSNQVSSGSVAALTACVQRVGRPLFIFGKSHNIFPPKLGATQLTLTQNTQRTQLWYVLFL